MEPIVTVLIQARMNSTRLPGKAMMDLAGKPLIQHVFDRAKAIQGAHRVVLATCDGDENLEIIRIAEAGGIEVFVGSEENVLERFYLASERFGGDYLIRITADNPFTDPVYAATALETAIASRADVCYLSNLPLGTGVGIIKKSALDQAYRNSTQPHHFEHVTPYLKEHPDLFSIVVRPSGLPDRYARLRLTVDTSEDYEVAREIYRALYQGSIMPLSEVIAFLDRRPDVVELNSGIVQRPMTHVGVVR